MLMGLATKNSILLVDFANQERKRGASADQAMRKAGPIRLRPILMTAISLIAGMIPVALGLGAGGDFRAPMAIGIIGGMTTSTLLTLFIVPLAYAIWVGFQDRWYARRSAKKEAVDAAESAPEPEASPA
jgi:HAE1 family hydrophobic/amphiphilic exporter-1